MLNEIKIQFEDFYKQECLDIYFDYFESKLPKESSHFFKNIFISIDQKISNYFQPMITEITKCGQIDSIDGPIINCIRK